jgi:hypothetical protein
LDVSAFGKAGSFAKGKQKQEALPKENLNAKYRVSTIIITYL